MGYLLDTDVIIWHLRGHEATRALILELSQDEPLACSAVSVFEVWSGVRPREENGTQEFLGSLRILPVDLAIAQKAGDYWRHFRGRGITLGQGGALIAATAQVSGRVLATYNRDHYPMDDIHMHERMPAITPRG